VLQVLKLLMMILKMSMSLICQAQAAARKKGMYDVSFLAEVVSPQANVRATRWFGFIDNVSALPFVLGDRARPMLCCNWTGDLVTKGSEMLGFRRVDSTMMSLRAGSEE
jgi:hypothetical protein